MAKSSLFLPFGHCSLTLVLVYLVKRPADFGAGLRPNENDSHKKLYDNLIQRDESFVMVQKNFFAF